EVQPDADHPAADRPLSARGPGTGSGSRGKGCAACGNSHRGNMTVPAVADVFARALQNHRAGNLGEARRPYQEILRVAPDHADSHHLLGVLAYQRGRYDEAVRLIRHALTLNPGAAVYHSNLGATYEALDQTEEALASFQQFLRLQPDAPEAYNA